MADLVSGFQGGQEFTPSGGPQTMSPEAKLEDMLRMMGGAPNSVLMMIARILGQGGSQPAQGPASNAVPEGQWQNMFPMPPVHGPAQFPGIDSGFPTMMRPSLPENRVNPSIGFVRG